MTKVNSSAKALLWTGLALITLRLIAAWLLPVIQDEAYYFVWAKNLSWGYLDHPPLVALLATSANLVDTFPLVARLGTVLASILVMVSYVALLRRAGLRDMRAIVAGLVISQASLAGLLLGIITTPDTMMILAWILTLHEVLAALDGRPQRWLSAGAAAGLGLLAKYQMVLVAPVLFWAMVRARPLHGTPPLKTPWPYAGAFVALMVFLPNVLWNAQNEFVTMNYQLRHGFSVSAKSVVHGLLPKPLEEKLGSPEDLLGKRFAALEPPAEERPKEPEPSVFQRALKNSGDFLGGQLGLWGALLIPLGLALIRWRRENFAGKSTGLSAHANTLMLAATVVPLGFFGALAFVTKVEANWAATYMVGASICLAALTAKHPRWLMGTALVNGLLVLGVAAHARAPLWGERSKRDRILLETHGYEELARFATTLGSPLFGDTYQVMAMLKFYQPQMSIGQWPGITRPSEFTRSELYAPKSMRDNALERGFWLLTSDSTPPRLPRLRATIMTQLRDCAGRSLEVIREVDLAKGAPTCTKPLHTWHAVHYEAER